jgi:hypothetical protein
MTKSELTPEEKLKKAEALGNSRDIYGWRVSDHPEVQSVLDRILEEMKSEFRIIDRYKKKYQNNIRVIVLDLFVANQTDPTMYITYSRNSNDYKRESKYYRMYLRYQIVIKIINFLIKKGYIDHFKGYYRRDRPHDSKISRMRATNKLIHLLVDEYKVDLGMIKWDEREPMLILRDYDKSDIKNFTDDDNTIQMRENLRIINKNLEKHAILLWVPDIELIEIKKRMKKKDPKKGTLDFSKKFVRRIFNNCSFEQGGRFYGGFWQNIPKGYRKYIRLNEKEVVELDYSGLHINMLYALKKIPVPVGDVYHLDGYSNDDIFRDFVKRMLLVMVNASDRSDVRGVLHEDVYSNKDLEMPDEIGSTEAAVIDPLMNAFANKHEGIKDYFCTGKGIDLQYLDSQIAEGVLLHFSKMGYAILPMHDSFIIHQNLENELRESMEKAFFDMFGVKTDVDLKYRSYEKMHEEGVYKRGECNASLEELTEHTSEQGQYSIYNRLLNQHRKYK